MQQPEVWIMMRGELNEGGRIVGVYLDKDLAAADFLREAADIDGGRERLAASLDLDGTVYAEGGCDWLDLSRYDVTTRQALPAGSCGPPGVVLLLEETVAVHAAIEAARS